MLIPRTGSGKYTASENPVIMDYQPFITRDPAVCGGEPIVAETRVTARTVLASRAEGMPIGEIVADFPSLNREAVRAVIAFAAVSVEEDLAVSPAPALP